MNGTEHSTENKSQDSTVITNASFVEILSSMFLFVITREPPTIRYKRIGTA